MYKKSYNNIINDKCEIVNSFFAIYEKSLRYFSGSVCRKSPYTNEWDSKGTVFLWSGQGLTALVGCGAKPHK
jgi:hypothetical protein